MKRVLLRVWAGMARASLPQRRNRTGGLPGPPSLTHLLAAPAERPDRPRDLELTDLAERSVRLTWIPGDDNNSPITGQRPGSPVS